MVDKKVSVIIPTYARPRHLKRSVFSCLNQTYSFVEIIVVDDNDSNSEFRIETERVMTEFADFENVIYIKHDRNRNGAAARNTGIKKATGDYIAFLDDDDEWYKDKLEKQITKAIESKEKYVFVYCKSIVSERDFDKESPSRGILKNELVSDYIFLQKGFIPTPSIFLSRELALKCLFDENLKRHQDYDFIFKVEKNEVDFIFIDEVLTKINWVDKTQTIMVEKGESPEFSEKFALARKDSFSKKSFSIFILHKVILKYISMGQYARSFSKIIEYKLFSFPKLSVYMYAWLRSIFVK